MQRAAPGQVVEREPTPCGTSRPDLRPVGRSCGRAILDWPGTVSRPTDGDHGVDREQLVLAPEAGFRTPSWSWLVPPPH